MSQSPQSGAGKRFFCGGAILFCLALCLVLSPVSAAVFQVDSPYDEPDANPGDGVSSSANGRSTLRAAIMEANALPGADVIVLQSNTTYTLTIGPSDSGLDQSVDSSGDLDITDSVEIQGNGSAVDGNGIDRVFDIHGSASKAVLVTLDDLTVTGGRTQGDVLAFGGGIQVRGGGLIVKQCTVRGNQAVANGGGIAADSVVFPDSLPTSLTLESTTVTGNTGNNGGGVYCEGSELIVEGSTISNNDSAGDFGGGGVFVTGSSSVLNSTGSSFSANQAAGNGGGLIVASGAANITGSFIDSNQANGSGGGLQTGPFDPSAAVSVMQSGVTLNVADVTNSGAGHGGAVYNKNAQTVIGISRIVQNSDMNAVAVSSDSSTVTAENNWWGCNTGPGSSGCEGIEGMVDADPWIVLGLSATPSAVSPGGGESDLLADLTHNSNGADLGTAETLPDGIPVSFSTTGPDQIVSADSFIVNGQAHALFRAGDQVGIASPSVLVDGTSVHTDISIRIAPTLWMVE